MKRTAMKRKRKPPDPAWTEARRTVLDRDRVCQRHPDMPGTCFGALHVHHIKRRSQGGTDDPWNLVALCPVHHGWVHEHPEMARRMGLLA